MKPDIGTMILTGFVIVIGAIALLILLERNPRAFVILLVLAVVMVGGTWLVTAYLEGKNHGR